jgi:hypothetical protein
VYYVRLALLVSSVTHSYRRVLRSSCPFGVFSHSLIQKCITFISQSLTHTEVYYVHLAPLVSSVTHSYRSVSSCPFGVFSHSLIQKCITFISQSLTHTEVYHLVPLVSSVTHSYISVSSCPFGVFSHSLILKCIILPLWRLQTFLVICGNRLHNVMVYLTTIWTSKRWLKLQKKKCTHYEKINDCNIPMNEQLILIDWLLFNTRWAISQLLY